MKEGERHIALYKWGVAWEEILIAGRLKNAMNCMRHLALVAMLYRPIVVFATLHTAD